MWLLQTHKWPYIQPKTDMFSKESFVESRVCSAEVRETRLCCVIWKQLSILSHTKAKPMCNLKPSRNKTQNSSMSFTLKRLSLKFPPVFSFHVLFLSGRTFCRLFSLPLHFPHRFLSLPFVSTARTRITTPPQDQSVIKGTKAIMTCGVTHDPSVNVR